MKAEGPSLHISAQYLGMLASLCGWVADVPRYPLGLANNSRWHWHWVAQAFGYETLRGGSCQTCPGWTPTSWEDPPP
jgi:hypothetical protein